MPGCGTVDLAGGAVERGAQQLLLGIAEPGQQLAFRAGDALFQLGE
jgi:hypothetical protein